MKHTKKIALVTGGSRGLGRAIALQLARDGADIVLTYREQKSSAESVVREVREAGRRCEAMPLDVAESRRFPEFAAGFETLLQEKWGRDRFDFLINNAGNDLHAPIDQTSTEDFDRVVDVHFKGVYFLTQHLLTLLSEGGRILNTSSGLARFTVPGYSAYGACKGAIEVFTRYLAKELGPRGITANVIAPGIIETDFTRNALARPGAREFFNSTIALGRVGAPDDIAGIASFLCSAEVGWINGERIEASGGMFL